MNWIEWKGEKVGDMHDPVCVCLMTHIDNRCIYAILPRAYCCTEGDPEGKGWCYFEATQAGITQLRITNATESG